MVVAVKREEEMSWPALRKKPVEDPGSDPPEREQSGQ